MVFTLGTRRTLVGCALRSDFLLRRDAIKNFVVYEGAFSDLEVDSINLLTNELTSTPSTGTYGVVDYNFRSSESFYIQHSSSTEWLFEKLQTYVLIANADHFGFSITGFEGEFQIIEYSSTGSNLKLHMDRGYDAPVRKLSAIVQLSDPAEYSGCDVELLLSEDAEVLPKTKGTLIIFPSFIMHRVTPLLSGKRRSLVSWVTGPGFI